MKKQSGLKNRASWSWVLFWRRRDRLLVSTSISGPPGVQSPLESRVMHASAHLFKFIYLTTFINSSNVLHLGHLADAFILSDLQ